MVATQQFLTTLVYETCCNCGVPFGMTQEMNARRRNDHQNFYCPNGHPQHYTGETEEEKLRRRLVSANSTAQSWKDQAETAEARRRGQKAANTRLKKRIAAGVCPSCHRNFQDLRNHMVGQHPNYATTETE